MQYLCTECHRGAWDCGREQRRTLLRLNHQRASKLQSSASESGRHDTTNYCGTSRASNNKGIPIQPARLMSCATGPSLLVPLVRVAGVAGCERVKRSATCSYRTALWEGNSLVAATVSSHLFVVWEKEGKKQDSSLSIALATPVSFIMVHIAIVWVGYHRNCPSQTRQ